MADGIVLERAGIPAVSICTDAFRASAGAMAKVMGFPEFEYVAVPQNILYRLPDALSFDHAAMIEAVSIAVHAVNLTPRLLGETAVVVGAGMIGQLTIQAAKVAGFGRVFAVDIDDAKLARAKTLGADEIFNSKTCDAPAEIAERTGGRGADAALEAVGATDPIRTALASVRKIAMASSSLRRCPTTTTPRSFKSSAVKFGRTASSISFWRNVALYRSRPSLRSQSTRSMAGNPIACRCMIPRGRQTV